VIKILITDINNNTIDVLLESGKPEIGKHYYLEDATTGSLAQGRLFHLLIKEWDVSGCCPWSSLDLKAIKDQVKLHYGQGFESYLYWNGEKIVKVSVFEDIPKDIRDNRNRCFGKLKSWADYTMKQRRDCIDTLILKMIESGVNSPRFNEICAEVTDR
jgi:hypothetical protein